jgi:septum formation protein
MKVGASVDRSLWRSAIPLVLASTSESRRALLASAGLVAETQPPNVDERFTERQYLAEGGLPDGLASALAQAKALAVSALRPKAYCLGADQTLSVEKKILRKPTNLTEAAQSIAALAGRTHRLTSAFCIALSGKTLVVDEDHAELQMRPLTDEAIRQYLEFAGPAVFSSVGSYQLEGLGIHLFDRIDGDNSTILGIPMLKLLAWLRRQGLIAL